MSDDMARDMLRRFAADQRILTDIERMERLMQDERSWAECVGCGRLRSTLERGVCAKCQKDGIRTRINPAPMVVERIVEVPVAEPVGDVPEPSEAPLVCPCTGGPIGEGDCDPACGNAPDATDPEYFGLAPVAAEPKQKPVKRRWWKRSR